MGNGVPALGLGPSGGRGEYGSARPPGKASQVSGRTPVIAVLIGGFHISSSCKLFLQGFPPVCPGDQETGKAVGGGEA